MDFVYFTTGDQRCQVAKNHTIIIKTVLAFLAINRQIRDFGLRYGDGNLALAIDRQSPKIGDFQPKNWRYWRNSRKPGDIGDFKALIALKVEISAKFRELADKK